MKVKELVEKHTKEGNIDWEAVEAETNEGINTLIAAKKDSAATKAKEEATVQAKKELLESLGLEGIESEEQLKEHISKLSKTDNELQKEYDKLKTQNEEISNQLEEYKGTTTKLERKSNLLQKGITDEDMQEFLIVTLEKRINDDVDFNKALETYAEEKPHMFQSTPLTTGSKAGTSTPTQKTGWEAKLAEKYPELKEE